MKFFLVLLALSIGSSRGKNKILFLFPLNNFCNAHTHTHTYNTSNHSRCVPWKCVWYCPTLWECQRVRFGLLVYRYRVSRFLYFHMRSRLDSNGICTMCKGRVGWERSSLFWRSMSCGTSCGKFDDARFGFVCEYQVKGKLLYAFTRSVPVKTKSSCTSNTNDCVWNFGRCFANAGCNLQSDRESCVSHSNRCRWMYGNSCLTVSSV